MSGRKQHIVPRFVQLGFSINDQTFVFTKEKKYCSNIKDVLAEKDFYSSPQDTTIDDKITAHEANLYLGVINNLLALPSNKIYPVSQDLTETILHFIFRAKYVRTHLIENTITLLEKSFDKDFQKTLLDELTKRAKSGSHLIVKEIIRNTEFFPQEYKDSIKNGFIKQLNETIVNKKQLSQSLLLKNCYYKIIKTDENLILPDCFLTCLLSNGSFNPFPEEEFDYMFLPIESNKLLIISKTINFKNFNINQLKIELAKSSNEKFISKIDNESNLQKEIGKNKFLSFIDEFKNNITLNHKENAIKCINDMKEDFFKLSPEKYKKIFK